MTDPKVSVRVEDLRFLLLRVEDWAHEVRRELEALPNSKKIGSVKKSELSALRGKTRPTASKGDHSLARRVKISERLYKCAGSVPLVGPWPTATDICGPVPRSSTSVLARDVGKALQGIEGLVGHCRLYVSKMRPTTVIRSGRS